MFSIGGRRIRRKTMTIRTLIVDDEAHARARDPRSQAPRVVVMSETEAAQAGLSLPTAASAKPKCC